MGAFLSFLSNSFARFRTIGGVTFVLAALIFGLPSTARSNKSADFCHLLVRRALGLETHKKSYTSLAPHASDDYLKFSSNAQLQEAAWVALDSGDRRLFELTTRTLESELSSLPIASMEPQYGGTTEAYLVTFEGGLRAVFKPDPKYWRHTSRFGASFTGVKSEVDAYKMSRELNVDYIPVTLEREIDGMRGSLQAFVEQDKQPVRQRDLELLNLFLRLITNIDAKPEHILRFHGRPVGIDNAASFRNLTVEIMSGHRPPEIAWPARIDESFRSFYIALRDKMTPDRIRELFGKRHSWLQTRQVIASRAEILEFLSALESN